MIRCKNLRSLSYLEPTGILFEWEELVRWYTVDLLLAQFSEYTGNGIITGWVVTSVSGLTISVGAGSGFASGVYCRTTTPTELVLPDDSTVYIYSRYDGSERVNVGEASPEYSPDAVTITYGVAYEDYSAHIAKVVTAGGTVTSITQVSAIQAIEEFYNIGKAIIDAHEHDGTGCALVDIATDVTGLLPGTMIDEVPASKITGEIGSSHIPTLDHRGLWDYPAIVSPKEFLFTKDYYTYHVTEAWEAGTVPTVWRNGSAVSSSEYTYDQAARTITFVVQQDIGAEIEAATSYTTYTLDVDVTSRTVSYSVYVNGSAVSSGYTVSQTEDTVTIVFDTARSPSDSVSLVVFGYYLTDVGSDLHFELDNTISKFDVQAALHGSTAYTEVALSALLADRHRYQSFISEGRIAGHTGEYRAFTFGVDSYDTDLSTIPEPDTELKSVTVPWYGYREDGFEWDEGTFFGVYNDEGTLRLSTRPVSLVILVDTSGSMQINDPTDIRVAAMKQLVSDLVDSVSSIEVAVIGFSSTYSQKTTWTSDQSTINAALDACADTEGETDYLGALLNALSVLRIKKTAEVGSTYKMAVLVTDGEQTVDTTTVVDDITDQYTAIESPLSSPIYCVGISDNVDPSDLLELSRDTNGVFFYCASAENMSNLAQYILSGDGSNMLDQLHTGYWEYLWDPGRYVYLEKINITAIIPDGCAVWVEWEGSNDNKTWTDVRKRQVTGDWVTIQEGYSYWKFRIVLQGTETDSPYVSDGSLVYPERVSHEFWSVEYTHSEHIFEAQGMLVASIPTGCTVYFGIWQGGELTWGNCNTISVWNSEGLIRRGLITESIAGPYRIVLRLVNDSSSDTVLHDWSVLLNTKGAWM